MKRFLSIIHEVCPTANLYGTPPIELRHLSQNYQDITDGDTFIAICGLTHDGHQFIDKAIQNGAICIFCENMPKHRVENICYVVVKNTRDILGPLAQYWYGNPQEKLSILGVTGTNGKTTTCFLIYDILKQIAHEKVALISTLGYKMGHHDADLTHHTTPEPIKMAQFMKKCVENNIMYLVMEVSSHALVQGRVSGINFDILGYTNLSQDHLDYHQTMDDYIKAKQRFFIEASPNSTAIFNGDDEYVEEMLKCYQGKKIIAYSHTKGSHHYQIHHHRIYEGMCIDIEDQKIKTHLYGEHNACNVVMAYLFVRALDYDKKSVANAIRSFKGVEGRMEMLNKTVYDPKIIIDYAHTPSGLDVVLKTLKMGLEKRQLLWVVFGCGGDRDASKRSQMGVIVAKYADHIIITSDNPRHENVYHIIDDIIADLDHHIKPIIQVERQSAIDYAIKNASADDVVLIAGKGHETSQIIGHEVLPFSDKEEAYKALKKRKNNFTYNNGNYVALFA